MAAPQSAPGSVPVVLAKRDTTESFTLGPYFIRVLEDGSHTDNRIGAVSIVVPPKTDGPPQHWHRMHDETFLVTRGTLRFTSGTGIIDAKAGDLAVVPPKSYHTFANPFDEEAEFFNTYTPAYYVDYLRLMSKAQTAGAVLDAEETKRLMYQFATFPPVEEAVVG
ncbi:MAG: hypothetical protein M1818_001414 [Claussenomyces sp. TS43310]|nr:MAG: hypothetical protein M1818_001414 [Claussenomyces sp. TS43310]